MDIRKLSERYAIPNHDFILQLYRGKCTNCRYYAIRKYISITTKGPIIYFIEADLHQDMNGSFTFIAVDALMEHFFEGIAPVKYKPPLLTIVYHRSAFNYQQY